MAQAKSIKKLTVELILQEDEARILMSLIQNPLQESESRELRRFRHDLFNSLKDAGILPR